MFNVYLVVSYYSIINILVLTIDYNVIFTKHLQTTSSSDVSKLSSSEYVLYYVNEWVS